MLGLLELSKPMFKPYSDRKILDVKGEILVKFFRKE